MLCRALKLVEVALALALLLLMCARRPCCDVVPGGAKACAHVPGIEHGEHPDLPDTVGSTRRQ